jgi:hypothetical protein
MSPTNAILTSLHEWYGNDFQEALSRSLLRVHQHAQTRAIGIISANLQTNTAKRNKDARHELTEDIRKAGFGYTHVKSVGQEDGKAVPEPSMLVTHVKSVGQEDGKAVPEPSMLVIGHKGEDKNRLKNFLVNHGAKYGQTGVLYKDQGQENAKFIHTSPMRHGEEEDLGKFHANRSAAQFFTKLKGKRQFSFEDVEVVYLRPIGFFTRRPMIEW